MEHGPLGGPSELQDHNFCSRREADEAPAKFPELIFPWQADFLPLFSQQGSPGYRCRCGVFHNVILPILYPVLLENPGLFPTTCKASSTLFSKLLAENQTLAVSSKKSRRDFGWCVPILFVFCRFPAPPDLLFRSLFPSFPSRRRKTPGLDLKTGRAETLPDSHPTSLSS